MTTTIHPTPPIEWDKPKWQRIRAVLMITADFTCQRCDWEHPNAPRQYDGSYAPWCRIVTEAGMKLDGRPWMLTRTVQLEIDHIKPRLRGGLSTLDNLQVLCNICNASKGAN